MSRSAVNWARSLRRRGARTILAVVVATVVLSLMVVIPAKPAGAAGTALYGLRKAGTSMIRFDAAAPGSVIEIPITGLAGGEFLKGIDVRPNDGRLYGYGSNGTLYRLAPTTGAATIVSANNSSIFLDLGFDFNQVVDVGRAVATAGANLRLNANTGVFIAFDTTINPAGFSIGGVAYTPGATTTLFGIDATGDRLVQIGGANGAAPSPNSGTTTAIGPLGVDTSTDIGFDISPQGAAFASLTVGGTSNLYTINLTTGAATLVGAIPGGTLTGLAVGPLDPFIRLAGPDRIDTAIATSTNSFPTAGSAPGVVLARSDVAADALAGTPLTKVVGGPLLLTASGVLDGRTQAELQRVLGAPGKTVHLLGGPAALSANVDSQIKALGFNTVRHGGADRFETAAIIAQAVGAPGTVFLADGTGFADALIAGVAANKVGGVVLLTQGATLPAATNDYLTSHPGQRFTLGPSSQAFPGGTAIAGADPFERSVSLATQFWPTSSPVVGVASGEEFPDGLTGGAHISRSGGPLFLVTTNAVPQSVNNYLSANHLVINAGFLYGGSVRITDAVLAQLQAAIS